MLLLRRLHVFSTATLLISVCRIIECPEAAKAIAAGDEVEVDFDSGVITDKTTGQSFQGQAFPEFMQKIITAGGLVNYINQK